MADPIMEVIFGKMPINQLSSVQIAMDKSKASNTIVLLGIAVLVAGIIAYEIHEKNFELKKQMEGMKIRNLKDN